MALHSSLGYLAGVGSLLEDGSNCNTSLPNGLDADNDGNACEELGGTGTRPEGSETIARAEDANGANRQSEDAFRCESYSRVVRDVRGNARQQYQGDELIGGRFEQAKDLREALEQMGKGMRAES